MGGLERRRFEGNYWLVEEPAPPVEPMMLQHLLNQYDRLSERISSLETEVSSLKNRVDNPPKNALRGKGQRAQIKRKMT